MRMYINKNLIYLGLFCGIISSCAKDTEEDIETPGPITVAETEINGVVAEGKQITINIESNSSIQAVTDNAWATPSISEDGKQLIVDIEENLWQNSREAVITLTNTFDETATVNIEQDSYSFSTSHHYKLPVVFHVLYNNEENSEVYFPEGHMQKIIDKVNQIYRESGSELNVEFTMATVDNNGNRMSEPGVNRVKTPWYVLSPTLFMYGDESAFGRHKDHYWDPTKYVNIFVYKYVSAEAGILGISEFPVLPSPYEMDGLNTYPDGVNFGSKKTPNCVCVNSSYLYDFSSDNDYWMSDAAVTVAHELGHYLGLYHAFNQNPDGGANSTAWDKDSDYCTDTPPYRKDLYDASLTAWLKAENKGLNLTSNEFMQWVGRTNNLTNEEFDSENIMDYAVSYANKITPQQAERVRYVLHHSVLIPGPKDFSNTDFTIEWDTTRSGRNSDNIFNPHFIECECHHN